MPRLTREWLVPAGLVALSLVPAIAGTVRLAQIATGTNVTPDTARFHASPWPVSLHIVAVLVFSLVGAFQFAPRLRRQRRGWHRAVGRIVLPCGVMAALTGMWMARYYEWPQFDGYALYLVRMVVGTAMLVALVRGALAIRQRDWQSHGAWMMRAYALGLGAGTQVLTHIPWFAFPELRSELSRTIMMAAAWAINAAVAEWVIARGRTSMNVAQVRA